MISGHRLVPLTDALFARPRTVAPTC
jgi:hypothetical protein